MIQTRFNAISSGATGMFGRQVVRYIRNGREIIAKAPPKRPGKGTPGQERTRGDFRLAAAWSQRVRTNDTLKERYRPFTGDGKNMHNLAIADYLVAPVVHHVSVIAGRIIVNATDNLLVNKVSVAVYAASGELLEEGLAGLTGSDTWTYTPALGLQPGNAIMVIARDMLGNECRYETEVPKDGVSCMPKAVYKVKMSTIRSPFYLSGIVRASSQSPP